MSEQLLRNDGDGNTNDRTDAVGESDTETGRTLDDIIETYARG